MKKLAIITLIGTSMALSVGAGDWGKAPVSGKEPYCPEAGPFEFSAGYHSHYIFRGYIGALDATVFDVNYEFRGLAIPVTVGYTRIDQQSSGSRYSYMFGDYRANRNIFYANALVGEFAGFDVTVGGAYYYHERTYPDYGRNDFFEVTFEAVRDLGFADLIYTAAYGFGTGSTADNGDYYSPKGLYNELALSRTFQVSERIDAVASAGVAYLGDRSWGGYYNGGEYGNNSMWNHYFLKLELPIEIKCNMVLTPYVGFNGSPKGWASHDAFAENDYQKDQVHTGVTFSASF